MVGSGSHMSHAQPRYDSAVKNSVRDARQHSRRQEAHERANSFKSITVTNAGAQKRRRDWSTDARLFGDRGKRRRTDAQPVGYSYPPGFETNAPVSETSSSIPGSSSSNRRRVESLNLDSADGKTVAPKTTALKSKICPFVIDSSDESDKDVPIKASDGRSEAPRQISSQRSPSSQLPTSFISRSYERSEGEKQRKETLDKKSNSSLPSHASKSNTTAATPSASMRSPQRISNRSGHSVKKRAQQPAPSDLQGKDIVDLTFEIDCSPELATFNKGSSSGDDHGYRGPEQSSAKAKGDKAQALDQQQHPAKKQPDSKSVGRAFKPFAQRRTFAEANIHNATDKQPDANSIVITPTNNAETSGEKRQFAPPKIHYTNQDDAARSVMHQEKGPGKTARKAEQNWPISQPDVQPVKRLLDADPVAEEEAQKADQKQSPRKLNVYPKTELLDAKPAAGTPRETIEQYARERCLHASNTRPTDTGLELLEAKITQICSEQQLETQRSDRSRWEQKAAERAKQDADRAAQAELEEKARKRAEALRQDERNILREEAEKQRQQAVLDAINRRELEHKHRLEAQRVTADAEHRRAKGAEQRQSALQLLSPTPKSTRPVSPPSCLTVSDSKTITPRLRDADDDDYLVAEEPEKPKYQSLSNKLKASKAASSGKQSTPQPAKTFVPGARTTELVETFAPGTGPKSLASREGTAAIAKVNQSKSRTEIGTREITEKDGQVWLWRDTRRLQWDEICHLYKTKFRHSLSATTLRRRLEQFKTAIRRTDIGIDLIEKLADGDHKAKKLINEEIHGGVTSYSNDPQWPLGEITDLDAQLLQWREECHQYYQGTCSWTEISRKLECAGVRNPGENEIKARHDQVKGAVNEAQISKKQLTDLIANKEHAREDINQLVHGVWPVPGKPFWDQLESSTELKPRRPSIDADRSNAPRPRRKPSISVPSTPFSTPVNTSHRPTTGGKTIDENFFYHTLNQVAEAFQAHEQEQEDHQPEADEQDQWYFHYKVLRREFTIEELEEGGDDDDELDDEKWIECGPGSEDLHEMNVAASTEVLKTVPGSPAFASGAFNMTREPQSDGTLKLSISNPDIGRVQVRVKKNKRHIDERTCGSSTSAPVPRTVYAVKRRSTTNTEIAVDEMFGESTKSTEKVVESCMPDIWTDLDLANEAAIEIFAKKTVHPRDPHLGRLYVELEAKKADLRNGLVSLDKFSGTVESDRSGEIFEVWVEEVKLNGPRNI